MSNGPEARHDWPLTRAGSASRSPQLTTACRAPWRRPTVTVRTASTNGRLRTSKGPPTGAFRGAGIAARVAGIFGSLLVLVIGTMLLVWLRGLPWIGLQGANEVHLTKARQALELSADGRVTQIEMALLERRGDIRLLSESLVLAPAVTAGKMPSGRPAESASVAARRQLLSLLTAYPDVYERLTLVSASNGRVLAANDADLQGLPFADGALLQRLSTPGVVEHIETAVDPMAANGRSLVVARQVLEREHTGLPTGRVLGILVATVSIHSILGEFDRVELRSLGNSGSVSLFDQQRRLLAAFRLVPLADARELARPPAGEGIEGSFIEAGADGKDLIAVYRFVRIGADGRVESGRPPRTRRGLERTVATRLATALVRPAVQPRLPAAGDPGGTASDAPDQTPGQGRAATRRRRSRCTRDPPPDRRRR
jgi:hypothetical protein